VYDYQTKTAASHMQGIASFVSTVIYRFFHRPAIVQLV
jgi:hypothetical protein